jgi:hypothetical protein
MSFFSKANAVSSTVIPRLGASRDRGISTTTTIKPLTRSTGGASASGRLKIQRAVVPSLKATKLHRIEIFRKEQKEHKKNKCHPYQKFIIVYWSLIRAEMLKGQCWPVIPDRSLTGSGIQGNARKKSR